MNSTTQHRSRSRLALLVVFGLLVDCGDHGTKPAPSPQQPSRLPPPIDFDFGIVPHGEQREARIEIPLPAENGPWTPVGFSRSCTCVNHAFAVRGKDGTERQVAGDGRPDPVGAIGPGEHLELRLMLDTREKEAADLEPVWAPGQVILQGPAPAFLRRYVPVRFKFGIHAPLQLEPAAHLALGDLPRPIRYEQSLQIHRRGQTIALGTPEVVELSPDGVLHHPGDVEVKLDASVEPALLTVAVKPSDSRPDGPLQCSIRIPTDLESGYVLRIPLSGNVVGAIEVEPPGVFSFGRIDMSETREMRLRIIDHDLARSADFVVVAVLGDDGKDLSKDFAVALEPIAGRPRDRIVSFRYLGHLQSRSFRGEVQLAKAPTEAPAVRLPFVGFSNR